MPPVQRSPNPPLEPTIRVARSSDVEAIVNVHAASSADAYAPLAKTWAPPDVGRRRSQWLDWIREGERSDALRLDLVAEVESRVAGFISGGPARDPALRAELEIYVIHVLPPQRGAGIGAQLWAEACQRLRGPTLRSMYVSTLAELRCCSFYRRHGGAELRRQSCSFHGAERTAVSFFWDVGHSSQPRAVDVR